MPGPTSRAPGGGGRLLGTVRLLKPVYGTNVAFRAAACAGVIKSPDSGDLPRAEVFSFKCNPPGAVAFTLQRQL